MSLFPVKIQNAHKYYNKGKSNQLHVMDNITLELPESGMVAIFGQSGCGKTTLLNAVGGLDKIASGSIELFGRNIREDTDTLRNQYIGYIFQNYNLNLSETVYENVSAALRLCGMTDEIAIAERTMAALTNVDMAKYRDRTPDTLSGGQQQRVAIARALVKDPAIILADEPTGNLDEANTVLVMDILKEISRTHLVLLVTHEADLVDFYCDRIIEIVDGHIHSDRTNEGANGYVQRNKNHIYLGELAKTETAAPGVNLEYYGEPTDTITLQVVNVGGKLYLKSSDPSVKVLDEGSEIKLMEGVFHEAKTAEERGIHGHKLDMSKLTPVEGKNYGRLYHWRNSLKHAWRENFSAKQKRGKKLLRVCLFLMAAVLVFMTASFGAGIRSYTDLRRDHNEHMFYIPLDPAADYGEMLGGMGDHGVDFARIIGGNPLYDAETLFFRSAAFMTAETVTVSADGQMIDVAHAEGLPVVAGEGTLKKGSSDILITTALADKLLESSTASYINEYADLIGMVSRGYDGMILHSIGGNANLRIVGVVESDELFYYIDGLMMAKKILNDYFWMPLVPASEVGLEDVVGKGQLAYREGYADMAIGDKVTILGQTFAVSRVIGQHTGIETYPDYVYQTHGIRLITDPYVYAEQEGIDPELALATWFFEHYFPYLPEFYEAKLKTLQPYDDINFEEWAVAKKQSISIAASLAGYDNYQLCAAYLYHEEYGHYPTSAEWNEFVATTDGVEAAVMDMMNYDGYYNEFDSFCNQIWSGGVKTEYYYVVSDEDYVTLACSAGYTDERLNSSTYSVWENYNGEPYYTNHLMLRSSDPAATAAYLTEVLGEDGFVTPDDIFTELFRDMRNAAVASVISVGVVVILMCLCVFFIMRSSFMSRVREVGILRAIGVTKRNLNFRFAVETALLITLTLVPGYLLSAWFIASLSGAALFSSMFYFPLWMAVGLFVVICAATLFFGVLPSILLLRRTPSEILSKYDI